MTSTKTAQKPGATARAAKANSAKQATAVVPAKKAATKAKAKLNGKAPHASASHVKPKLVRDSFTIPKAEYTVLESLKARATDLKRPTKKSEMLRAGIAALNAMPDKAFLAVLNSIPSLKTGRPIGPEVAAQLNKKSIK